MVTEDYVSFEIAKLLKEKGFNEDSWFHYDADGNIVTRGYRLNKPEDIPAWTLQMVMKWLREQYKIFICIVFLEEIDMYGFTIEDMSSKKYLATSKNDGYPTYEQTCEAVIKYCLKNLIPKRISMYKHI